MSADISGDKLETWAQIAAHLSVSVRTAQTWARDKGLPVRRLRGDKTRVFASRAELDGWSRSAEVSVSPVDSANGGGVEGTTVLIGPQAHSDPESPAATGPVDDTGHPHVPAVTGTRSSVLSGLSRRTALGFVGLSAATVGATFLIRKRNAALVRVAFVGNSVCGWDDMGRLVWSHPFSEPLNISNQRVMPPDRQITPVDFAGGGPKHFVVATAFRQPGGFPPDREELYCFSPEGRVVWRYHPEFTLTFGDTPISGPWLMADMIVVPNSQGENVVWLSLVHWNLRPGILVTLGPTGKPSVEFVSAGHSYTLCQLTNSSGRYILAGGVNNEYNAAAFAVLRVGAPPSLSPQTGGTRFECVDGPKGFPDRYFVLPASELNVAIGRPYSSVNCIRDIGDDLMVETNEAPEVIETYRFSKNIAPLDVSFSDSFAPWHRRLEGEGKLKHDLSHCPQIRNSTVIRRWDSDGGWTSITVAPSRSVKPGSLR